VLEKLGNVNKLVVYVWRVADVLEIVRVQSHTRQRLLSFNE